MRSSNKNLLFLTSTHQRRFKLTRFVFWGPFFFSVSQKIYDQMFIILSTFLNAIRVSFGFLFCKKITNCPICTKLIGPTQVAFTGNGRCIHLERVGGKFFKTSKQALRNNGFPQMRNYLAIPRLLPSQSLVVKFKNLTRLTDFI